jgi:hypothetical protein
MGREARFKVWITEYNISNTQLYTLNRVYRALTSQNVKVRDIETRGLAYTKNNATNVCTINKRDSDFPGASRFSEIIDATKDTTVPRFPSDKF